MFCIKSVDRSCIRKVHINHNNYNDGYSIQVDGFKLKSLHTCIIKIITSRVF